MTHSAHELSLYEADELKNVQVGDVVKTLAYYKSETGLFKVIALKPADMTKQYWYEGKATFVARRILKTNGDFVKKGANVTLAVSSVVCKITEESINKDFEAELKAAELKREFLLSQL